MEKRYFIYLTTNSINRKRYIGKHYGTLKDSYLGSGTILLRAIKKYGKEAFFRKILAFSISEEENCEKEKYFITLFDACHDPGFYNIHAGGSGGNTIEGLSPEEKQRIHKKQGQARKGIPGVKRSEEWKQQHSYWATNIRNNDVYRTEIYREKMSQLTSGKNNGMYNKHHSKESKQKMSETRQKNPSSGAKNGMYGKSGNDAINGRPIGMYDERGKLLKSFACIQAALSFLQVKGHLGLDRALKNGTIYKDRYWQYLKKKD